MKYFPPKIVLKSFQDRDPRAMLVHINAILDASSPPHHSANWRLTSQHNIPSNSVSGASQVQVGLIVFSGAIREVTWWHDRCFRDTKGMMADCNI